MEILKALPIIAIIVLIVFAAVSSKKVPSLEGKEILPETSATFTGVRTNNDKSARTIIVKPKSCTRSFVLDLDRRGVPNQSPEQARDEGFTYENIGHYYPIDIGTDLGVFASAYRKSERNLPVDIGLRYSPIRLAWGSVAPDLLVSSKQAGLGVSLYLPDMEYRNIFSSVGVGGAWMFHYDGNSNFAPYVSLTTRF